MFNTFIFTSLIVLLSFVNGQEAISNIHLCPPDDLICQQNREQLSPPVNQNVDATYTHLSTNAYACPSGYHYISYNDLNTNINMICPLLSEWSISRIQGGGSVDGNGYGCKDRLNDPRNLAQAVCIKTKITSVRIEDGKDCSSGYDVILYREAAANYKQICSHIGAQQTLRIGYQGSIQGGSCQVNAWSDQSLSKVLCVKRKILSTKLFNSDDDLCGQDGSFLTVEEVAANLQKYCNLIPSGAKVQTVRLAGGASLTKQSGNCAIEDENTKPLEYGLCGNANRPNIDGNN